MLFQPLLLKTLLLLLVLLLLILILLLLSLLLILVQLLLCLLRRLRLRLRLLTLLIHGKHRGAGHGRTGRRMVFSLLNARVRKAVQRLLRRWNAHAVTLSHAR